MDSNDYTSLILYYGRLHYYNTMQKMALDGLAKFPMQPEFRLFNGISLALGNRMQECIRELNPLKNESELGLAATMTLIYAHKHCHLIDRDALQALETRMSDSATLNNSSSAQSRYYAAAFLFLIDEFKSALENLEMVIKMNDNGYDAAFVLKIWCQLFSNLDQSESNSKIQNMLETLIARSNGKNIDASLVLARFYQKTRKFDEALSVIEKLSIRLPEISILLIEKMDLYLAALDWDQSLDTAKRVINLEPYNLSALRTKGVLHIIRESNVQAGTATLQQLVESVERIEPGNHKILLKICQLYSRICSRNFDTLQITHKCVEKMNQKNPDDVIILTELAYQKLLLNNIADAEFTFRSACDVNSRSFEALCGLTLCKLKTHVDAEIRQQIHQQLAFLMKLADYKPEPLVLYMSALMASPDQTKEQQLTPVKLLEEAVEIHFRKLEPFSIGFDYICHMNPDFLLELCSTFIRYTPTFFQEAYFENNLNLEEESMHVTIKDTLNILECILHVCPGHKEAMFLRAKVDFICGKYSNAVRRLQSILSVVGETFTDAYLLLAQVLVEQKQYSKAFEYLELALVHKFTVRDLPLYHLLKGIILKNLNKISEAHQSFLLAMQLSSGSVSTGIQSSDCLDKRLTSSDKMTLYIELIYILRKMPDSQGIYESERILQAGIDEFSGTAEIGRLVIAHSKLMIQKCDISKAISLLSTIKPDQTYYVQARIQVANIYLQQQKNRFGFSKCFKELVKIRPQPKSFLMLGEACLSIQDPTTAINAYQNAYKMSPSSIVLARELGRAYVKSHHYAKALKYYHEVIQNPDFSALKLDLAELFLKLKHYQNAINILSEADGRRINDDSLTELQLRTKRFLLLARVYEKSGNISESLKALDRARDNQYIVQKRCAVDQSENLPEQHKILSKICLLIAQQAILIKNNELALNKFKECMKYTPNDVDILVSLAKLQMKLKEMDLCQNTCLQILQIDSNNDSASVLMADLSFRRMEFENAAYHFSQLLLSQPCNWIALTRFIEVMKRFGTLSESLPFLQRAAQASEKYKNLSELNYCNGLFEWYNGNLNSALRHFNLSRRDPVWGLQAKLNMVDICLNPGGEIANSNDIFETGDSEEFSESRLIALRTAERLLKEIGPKSGENLENALTYRILWNFLQIASKQRFQIEAALKDFTELGQTEGSPLTVIVIYGTSLALVQLKQIQRAKNQLKRIARMNWSYEDAEYLERSWLLLADIYIHANKLDVAETLVDQVLEYNKSCTKAYELAGYIAEKTQSYNHAVKFYENAWKNCGRSKPHIGYKLALNNMKNKRYTNAVNVCQQVLRLYPEYTIIRKDILEKCRNNLRT